MSSSDVPELLPAPALARRLGVDAKWLCAELKAGRLPGIEAGKTALFDPELVEKLLLERARRSRGSQEDPGL